jgi:hypothetical protein
MAAALATAGLMVAIDVALANVDSSISRARDQAVGVARNTGDLPFLLAQMTQHLRAIDAAQRPIPGRETAIAQSLATTNHHLVANVHNNAVIENNQQTVDSDLQGIDASLSVSEQRLASILDLNTSIRDTLHATENSASGTSGLITKTAAINALQRAAERDSGNVLDEIRRTNDHLTSICEAPLMQVLGLLPKC